ncbi:uncharacterized protein LOC141704360 [Apium graveolens]|uniref:uncharacterized protein LOC141704360 n=1 Tax=Apium graveolens TaxID=4045 RepID=UPI003D7A8EA7
MECLEVRSLIDKRLNKEEVLFLERDFCMEEIIIALKSFSSDKAPGPDGLNMKYIKEFWPFLKDKVLEGFNWFANTGCLPKGFNSSFIALVPKVRVPNKPSEFRPISLINSVAKILTKVLANRLSTVYDKLVGVNQFGFVKGRRAAESIFIVNECLGLGIRWIKWMEDFFKSIRISVLVNGTPTKEFSMSNGIRQGDPLSPMLFNLTGEVLSSMLNAASEQGIIEGLQLGKEERLGCKLGSWPLVYLGSQIGVSSRKKVFWKPLVEKFRSKLANWKRDSLNQAGRLSLVKSTLDSLPIYWFTLHKVPVGVCNQLERIGREFFGETLQGMEKRKWWFKWQAERKMAWNVWLRGMYGCGQSEGLELLGKQKSCLIMVQGIIKAVAKHSESGFFGPRSMRWEVADRDSALFWEDLWYKDITIMERFPRLYSLSKLQQKEVNIFKTLWDCYDRSGEVFWKRKLTIWELEDLKELEDIVNAVSFFAKKDRIIWVPVKDTYNTRVAYELLINSEVEKGNEWEQIWKYKVPEKVSDYLDYTTANGKQAGKTANQGGNLNTGEAAGKMKQERRTERTGRGKIEERKTGERRDLRER